MSKIKVLMIGPGEPNALNSGLGVAANYIANKLARKTNLTLIQPENEGSSSGKFIHNLKKINADKLSEDSLISDLIQINVRAKISPYFYPYMQVVSADEDEVEIESEVKNELDHFTRNVVNEAENLDFDIIYAHDWTAVQAGVELKEKTNKPLVVHMHSLDYDRNSKLNKSWVHQVEKESFEKSDAIIGVSEYTSNVITEHYGAIDKKKVHTVYSGNEPGNAEPLEKTFDEKLVLFVGRLTGQKGPNLFLDIAQKVLKKHENTRFVLVGEGPLMQDLVMATAAMKLGGKFHFTGHIDQNQLMSLYGMADVYCMPSVSEPYGLAAIEAANAGVPVVLSRQSGASEVLSAALTADHWDVDGFAKHILSIFKSDKKSKKMVAENRSDLKSMTWDSTADGILKILQNLS
ncbi:MAG: glycosyltransferase family 4 protein [Cyclobacteriaceae bacterium]